MHELIYYLRYLHGLYNGALVLLFFYQGWMGLKMRKERIAGQQPTISIVKRHRRMGPIVAFLGITGFFAGVLIVYLNEEHIFKHPLHFITGLSIVALIFTTFIVSKKSRYPGASPWHSDMVLEHKTQL